MGKLVINGTEMERVVINGAEMDNVVINGIDVFDGNNGVPEGRFEYISIEAQTVFSGPDKHGNILEYDRFSRYGNIVAVNGRIYSIEDYVCFDNNTISLVVPLTAGQEVVFLVSTID